MKLWMSGEIQADIAEPYRETRQTIEAEINRLLEGFTLPEAFEEWVFIAIIRQSDHPDYPELAKKSRGAVLEFRLQISHDAFLRGTKSQRISLILAGLTRSVAFMETLGVSSRTQSLLNGVIKSAEIGLLGSPIVN